MHFYNLMYKVKIPKDFDSSKLYKKKKPRESTRGVSIRPLTDRQSDIIAGKALKVSKREIGVLIEKLNHMDLENELSEVVNRYSHLITDSESLPLLYTSIEAEGILQSLTPWILPCPKEVRMNNELSFDEKLKASMEKSHMRASELVRKSGISNASISKYLSGEQLPRKDAIEKLSKALNVDAEWLYGEKVLEGGSEEAIAFYNKLDDLDRRRVLGLMKALLKDLKYKSGT